ncbi:hypothetical protein pqer_cds_1182 [Pandoravirus quercus]|uniref:Uncharacterized protein n=1 Tax=Pandoravirus quercus TaxID=2107709 RepID=A0A2U7U7N5_9VIRU|nr:hypothetical protein pqer_cds_12 [Pandoravirus quercus]YP_009483873.1 hypothetical protein pqer_cds_1182 [Pandoravirus quercus]AVK74434.1 hypothetical protein pqer_cds_12 [Pandoravirus quercus]AVK75604.1 hypothetical protein pqer_cds_1182 [Pandoravirus quercus]
MDPKDQQVAMIRQARAQYKAMVRATAAQAAARRGQEVDARDDGDDGDGRTGSHTARGPYAISSILASFMVPSGTVGSPPRFRYVGSVSRRAEARRRALAAGSQGLHGFAGTPDRPTTTGDLDQESAPTTVASRARVDDDPTDITGLKRMRDAADEREDDVVQTCDNNTLRARQRRRLAAVTDDGTDGERPDADRAERLQHKLAAAAGLSEPGLVLQAAARVLSLCTPEETRALVTRAYANVVPWPLVDNGDDGNGVPGPRAPTAFVDWFGLHHAQYGLDDTPDFVWNTKVPPRSPREDDPWSRAYWLAGNARF